MPSATTGSIDPAEGRALFGIDPANYEAARPDYPERVYARLRDRCGLGPGAQVIEIGPGTGLATRHLAQAGAAVVALEPDPALAHHLARAMEADGLSVDVRVAAFEDASLPGGSFDLAVAAMSFHWIDQHSGLRAVANLLRPGGWWATWWNVFGDPARPDPFHDATQPWLAGLAESPAGGADRVPFPLDVSARIADLEAAGFDHVESDLTSWTLTLTTAQVRALYATYSPIARLGPPEREAVLTAIAGVADEQFGGQVERNTITALYTARRPPSS